MDGTGGLQHIVIKLRKPLYRQSTAYTAVGMHSTFKDLFIWIEAVKSNTLLSPELTKIIFLSNRSNLKDVYKLKGFPNRSYYAKIKEESGMIALQDFLNTLSENFGYKVNP